MPKGRGLVGRDGLSRLSVVPHVMRNPLTVSLVIVATRVVPDSVAVTAMDTMMRTVLVGTPP